MLKKATSKILGVSMAAALILAVTVPAYAADVDVDGEIGIQNPSSITYNVSFNATNTEWFVTEYSWPAVYNNATATNVANPYYIQNDNTSGIAYEVELTSFDYTLADVDGSTVAGDLTLNLTGDLANNGVGAIDLSVPYTAGTTYTAPLNPGAANQWTYGFSGSYAKALDSTVYNPLYVMELTFDIY